MKMVVSNSTNLAHCRSSFLSAMGKAVLISKEQTSSHDNVAEMISDLKVHIHVYTIRLVVDLYQYCRPFTTLCVASVVDPLPYIISVIITVSYTAGCM